MVTKIRKRDGVIVDFVPEKITAALAKAFGETKEGDMTNAQALTNNILHEISGEVPSVEDVQDVAERVLMQEGFQKTAKAYMLYREKRKSLRELRESIIGLPTNLKISLNALHVLKERYLLRDAEGNTIENPEGMFRRVAKAVASADEKFEGDVVECERVFYEMMYNLEFLPGSPTLMHAGTEKPQCASCFALPIEDNLVSIFDALKNAALVHQCGGGTGFNFSKLRPQRSSVHGVQGVSAGPVKFMEIFNTAMSAVKQAGRRQGGNMAILRVDHPDIMEFITLKEDEGALNNFNISVGITEEFMSAVDAGKEYALINPKNGGVVKNVSARHIFDMIVLMAWKTGDPGILFLDRINNSRANPLPAKGKIEATSPCAEQPLFPYEACNLGSLNLVKFVREGDIDWNRLRERVFDAVHFLDNVIEINEYPLPVIADVSRANRRIGLGVMGFADMLLKLNMKYDAEASVEKAREIMKFVSEQADAASRELARARGPFPNFKQSIYSHGEPIRNASRTTLSPTGTISMIAGVSSGIEPAFAISYTKRVLNGKELLHVNEEFERVARERGFYSDALMQAIANKGSIQDVDAVPEDVRAVFVVGYDIMPEWHIRMQAAFQAYTDNAVSKTVNFPSWATTEDVAKAYFFANQLGCKGVTIYRDGSKAEQVVNVSLEQKREKTMQQKLHTAIL